MQTSINKLEKIIADYTPQLKQLSEEDFTYKPLLHKWSGKEYLGHLIDSAQINIRRFVVGQYELKPYIVYDQEMWVAAANYQDYPLGDLIDLWALINKHIVILLKNMPEAVYENEVLTQDVHTLQWLAADYNKHLLHHLHQVLNLQPVAYP
ncbi:MAG: DinB family protein [Ferruginibacter sp.]|nr:DinB family protein [Ferruginibacter sp.]